MVLRKIGGLWTCIILSFFLAVFANFETVQANQLQIPTLYNTRDLVLELEATIVSNKDLTDVNVKMPLIQGQPLYCQGVLGIDALPPVSIKQEQAGSGSDSWYAEVHWDELPAGEYRRFDVSIKMRNSRPVYRINPEACLTVDPYAFAEYLAPEEGVESDHPSIINCASQVIGNARNPYEISRLLFSFVNSHMNYDLSASDNRRGALYALNSGRGTCQDYADLYVALCRAAGIPARLIYGLRYNTEEHGDLIGRRNVANRHHVWTEIYLESYQWVPVEPTYTYKLNGRKTISFDYYGTYPAHDLHIATGYENPPLTWNYKYSGSKPQVYFNVNEILRQE
ncbi:MAG TPA: hypothetical protein DCL69_12175 [Firmicutes bacterium]|nr:hypothetical protein [Bacillota bacterium]